LTAAPFSKAVANADNGAYMLQALAEGVALVRDGHADAFCFAPLNKGALRLGGMHQEDELRWFAEFLNFRGVCGELNVLQNLWTSRVTSHVALKEVSGLLTPQNVFDSIDMIASALKASGKFSPRLAVCGLNPHNGDNGNYGDEEITTIAPGVELAQRAGIDVEGPFPADTAFVRAIRPEGGYHGVVTMYHDQGQIAMKLMGFEQGVTVHGGLPLPICTPAHGTAYDIVGKNIANPKAMCAAFELACRMGQHHRQLQNVSTMATNQP
jgi:4-hydroxythreonine-4-phosphate dehydrogenase